MGIIAHINEQSQQRAVPFLVIGGHAVNIHGYSRLTYDLDLLILKDHRGVWREVLFAARYALYREHDHFMQFTAPTVEQWPLDFMLVNGPTFSGIWAEAVDGALDGTPIKVPSVRHLIALKLHVLKQDVRPRGLKDLHDVIMLIEANHIEIGSENFRQLCERYGNLKLYEELVRICKPA